MNEGGGKGVWGGLAAAVVVAVVFLVLWVLRGGDMDRLRAEMRAAETAATSTARRLEGDLASAKNEAEAVARRARENETRFKEDARRAAEAASQVERRLRADLADAERRVAGAAKKEAEAKQAMEERLGAEIATLREALTGARSELDTQKATLTRERAVLAADLEATRKSLKDAEARLAEKDKALAAVNNELKSTRAELMTSGQSAEELEALRKRFEEAEAGAGKLADELAAARKAAAESAEKAVADIEDLKKELEGKNALLDAGVGKETQSLLAVLRTELAAEREKYEKATAAAEAARELLRAAEGRERECRSEIEALEKREADYKSRMEAASEQLEKCREALGKDAQGKEPAGTDSAPVAFRHVGRISERLDGSTLLITVGIKQNVRLGMKFDVYRPDGDLRRLVGRVKLTRALEDSSHAVPVFSGMPAGLDAPAVGDYIDNPFFDPERRVRIAVARDVAFDPCVFPAIEAMGALPCDGGAACEADYLLVRDEDAVRAEGPPLPQRVSLARFANYLEPSPNFRF